MRRVIGMRGSGSGSARGRSCERDAGYILGKDCDGIGWDIIAWRMDFF